MQFLSGNLTCWIFSWTQVSKPGSVEVEKLMNIERYSHVMHISSTVCASMDFLHNLCFHSSYFIRDHSRIMKILNRSGVEA